MTSYQTDLRVPGFRCRFCGAPLRTRSSTSACRRCARARRAPTQLNQMEPFYPLHVYVCGECFLVQLAGVRDARARSSPSTPTSRRTPTSWVEHARALRRAMISSGFGLGADAASSSRSRATTATCCSTSSRAGVPVLGIEPAANVAAGGRRARASRRTVAFFGAETRRGDRARSDGRPTCSLGNNVLAQVPDLNDFVAGMKILLAPDGVDHDGVPAPAAADRRRTSSTRSTTSTSRYFSLVDRRADLRARTG